MTATTCQQLGSVTVEAEPPRQGAASSEAAPRRLPRASTTLGWGLGLLAAATPSLARGEASHPVFDLYANRTLAHIEQRDGLFIAAGAPGFARYQHFGRPTAGWKLRAEVEGKKVALPQTSAKLSIPLTAAQAKSQSVWVSLKSPSRSSLKISASGKTSQPATLNPGWQVVQVTLPADTLQAGENNLTLTFAQSGAFTIADGGTAKAAAAVQWLQVGGTIPPPGTEAPKLSDGSKLLIPGSGALYYYVQIPAGGALRLKGDGAGCQVKVTLDAPTAKGQPMDVALDGTALSLASAAGEVRRLGLHATGSCAKVAVSEAQLLTSGAAPVVKRDQRPRNVVFWLSDDTRADKYKLWNKNSRVETPVLDAFSQTATRFATAYSQGNESRVSHASLFTGLYPAEHHFINDKAVLSEAFTILPEAIKPSGLYTIGHIANGYITARWGFGGGWDLLKNHIHEGGGLKSADLVADARSFLTKGPGKTKPFFLYLGVIDAHVSWRAYEPWISKYDTKPYSGPFVKGCMDPQLDKIVDGSLQITARDRERVIALYDSDISYSDHQFGEMLELLKKTGHADDTMVVFASDHGEEFWDHGRVGHGQSLRQELVHIPMWIYYPPLFPAGKVVKEGAELVDLLPTITDALGVATPKEVQGESLLPLAQGQGAGYPRPAIASQYELAHTMRLGRYKLWVGGSGQVKLYDGQDDPGEQKELTAEQPIAYRFIADAMSLWMAYQGQWKKSRWGVASNQTADLPADLEK